MSAERPHIVILGGGFAGLYAAKELAGAAARVTLLDRSNHHLFQPLLYQVATAGLSAIDVAQPIRRILRRQKNTTVLLAEATDIEAESRRVLLRGGGSVDYDYLIVATGATHSYFGNSDWEQHAPGLKTIEDALEIRREVLLAFERAETETDPDRRRAWLTFVVVGGGPTGAELAGALAEISRLTLVKEFRNFHPGDATILLVEAGERILPTYPDDLSSKATRQLERLGVEVRTSTRVDSIDADGVTCGNRRIQAHTVLWAAGVQASPLGATLGAPTDRAGRVEVEPDLSVPGRPEIFVAGDLAAIVSRGEPVPGVAPAAIQQGRHAAHQILRRLRGAGSEPFRYIDRGSMATLGRRAAVAELGGLRLAGFVAWLAWLFIHILFLIGFRNRFVVLFEWALSYLTYQRNARVILYGSARTAVEPEGPTR